mmetsp:Transcript_3699/g.8309  ORF Transcript_3699/g.8309 Transcript_3699/m.8309 type:complete len:183 (+) Transcript_3699:1854-2402(+)
MQPPPVSKKSWPAAAAVSSHVPRVSAKRQTNLRLSRDHPLHSVSSNFSQCLRYVSHNLLIMVAMVPQCQCRPGGARHGAACPLAACDGACSDRIHGLTICFPIATPASASPKLVHPLRRYAFRSAASICESVMRILQANVLCRPRRPKSKPKSATLKRNNCKADMMHGPEDAHSCLPLFVMI